MIKFVVVPDLHGDQFDEKTVSVIRQYIDDYKPTVRVSIGDIFDFRNLRRGASESEKAESMRLDVKCGMDLIDAFKFTHVTLGNHDQRLWDEADESSGLIKEYCQRGVDAIESKFKHHGTEWVPYSIRENIQIGNAFFVHGFRCNVNAAKSTAEDFAKDGRTIFFGHTHSVSSYRSISGTTAHNIGCACNLDPHYSRRRPNTLRHQNCFASGEIHSDGTVVTYIHKPNNNKWRCVVASKEYTA